MAAGYSIISEGSATYVGRSEFYSGIAQGEAVTVRREVYGSDGWAHFQVKSAVSPGASLSLTSPERELAGLTWTRTYREDWPTTFGATQGS